MQVIDGLAVVVLTCCLLLVALVARRYWIARGGCVHVCMPRPQTGSGRHWVLGLGRYDAERLLWFRVFSLAPRPRVSIPRRGLRVESRRAPHPHESLVLQPGVVVLGCVSDAGPVELALDESALTGFLAWLESAPPGVPARR
jgi:hypothetical protein